LALMDHPCIAKVLDGGCTESGRPYFVMELVEGTSVTEYCDACGYGMPRRLELFIRVCQAVQHAHQKGIIHRDIKPSNILVTNDDDTAVPKVIDFGIAKALDQQLSDQSLYTHVSQMIGSPLYMSPEQSQRSEKDVDTRTDVYSLGVLLYELLTGLTPFAKKRLKGSGLEEIRRIIREEVPPKPSAKASTLGEARETIAEKGRVDSRALSQELRGELDWIVLKALEKDRDRRYDSAGELAKDLRRYLDGEAVEACPPSASYRFRKFLSRHRSQVAAFVVAVLAGFTMVAFTLVVIATALRRETALRHLAQQAQHRAERSELRARRMAYASDIALADQARRQGDVKQLVELLDRYVPEESDIDLRGFEWYYLRALADADHFDLGRYSTAVYFVCSSPDGRLLATAGEDAVVRIYDLDTRELVTEIESGQGEVNGVAFAPGQDRLASAGDDGTLRMWDLETGLQLLKIEAHPGEAYNVLFFQNGERLASCGADPVIRLWDADSGEPRGQLEGHTDSVESIAFSPGGQILASAASDETAKTWRTDSRACLQTLKGHEGRLSSLAFSPDGAFLTTGSLDKTVRVWNAVTGQLACKFKQQLDAVQGVAFGPSGQWIVAADRAGTVRLWSLEDVAISQAYRDRHDRTDGRTTKPISAQSAGERVPVVERPANFWKLHTGRIYSIATLPSRGQIVSAGEDGKVTVFGDKMQKLDIPLEGVESVWDFALTADGRLAVAESRTVRILDESGAAASFSTDGEADWQSIAVDSDGELLAAGTSEGVLSLWDVRTRSQEMVWNVEQRIGPGQLAVSPDGSKLVETIWGRPSDAVWIFDTSTGEMQQALPAEGCHSVAFSPDGARLVVDCENDLLVWDFAGRRLEGTWPGHTSTIHAIAFRGDGQRIASGGEDRSILLRHGETGKVLFRLTGHRDCIESIAFSPDGRTLASSDTGGCVKLWHVATGRKLLDLVEQSFSVGEVAFTPDGKRLVYRFKNGGVRMVRVLDFGASRKQELAGDWPQATGPEASSDNRPQ
ncbi:MAG: protein kinase, partial [Pirellulaceae bacterium]